ncbi:hypothetical protein HPHPA5_0804 [Helicobacter pylori Hp A-5]|nr:hypothetical protein HPHPA5_0804 [Helicobacter pylori Hp A-5]
MRESYLMEFKKESSSYPYLIKNRANFIISFLTSHRFF